MNIKKNRREVWHITVLMNEKFGPYGFYEFISSDIPSYRQLINSVPNEFRQLIALDGIMIAYELGEITRGISMPLFKNDKPRFETGRRDFGDRYKPGQKYTYPVGKRHREWFDDHKQFQLNLIGRLTIMPIRYT